MEIDSAPVYILIIGIVLLALMLAYLLALHLRLCFHLVKAPLPGWGARYAAALCQVTAGIAIALIFRELGSGPYLGIGVGLGAIILTGLFLYKLFFKLVWSEALKLWGVAAIFQVFLLPIFTVLLIFGLMSVMTWFFPPQYQ